MSRKRWLASKAREGRLKEAALLKASKGGFSNKGKALITLHKASELKACNKGEALQGYKPPAPAYRRTS